MKRILGFFLLMLCLTVHSQDIEAAGQNGLLYQVYSAGGAQPGYTQGANGNITNRTLLSSGTVSTVNFDWGGNRVLNTNYDGVIVRFYGYINIPTAGTYYFGGNADDGLRIKVNGVSTLDSWIESGGAFRSGSVSLPAGVVPIEVLYYENGGGAVVNLQWYINGVWQIVPSTALATDSTFFAPPPPPTPVYSSGMTAIQQNKRTSGLGANPNGHNAIVEITGDDNLISIQQIGGAGHYVNVNVNGSVNTVDIQQSATGLERHYLETNIVGSNNNLIMKQEGSSKTQFTNVDGNFNSITTNQKGLGNHFLDLRVTGNNHTAGVVQDGSGSHKATVELSGTQPWNFQLNQNGSTNKTYSLPHNMSDGSVTSGACYTVGGCSLIINQQ